MKLYDLPPRLDAGSRPKIYGLNPGGHEKGWVEFDHLDGMYSYCVAYDGDGTKLGVCHLVAWTELIPHRDGYYTDTDQVVAPNPFLNVDDKAYTTDS
jgi:hypothetical protein